MTRPYRSGHCTPGNGDEQHRRCTGAYAGAVCACDCHDVRTHTPQVQPPRSEESRARVANKPRGETYAMPDPTIDAFDWDQYAAMGESA